MKFLEKFKKKEKKEKSKKPKVVTQKRANTIVSGIIFLIIVITLTGTIRNFTAVGEVERLREEIATLQQLQRAKIQQEGLIDFPLVQRYMEEFIPLFINVDFANRDLVDERFERLGDYFSFPYTHMNYAMGSQMSRALESSELLSIRSYDNFNLAQFRITYTLTEKHLLRNEFEEELDLVNEDILGEQESPYEHSYPEEQEIPYESEYGLAYGFTYDGIAPEYLYGNTYESGQHIEPFTANYEVGIPEEIERVEADYRAEIEELPPVYPNENDLAQEQYNGYGEVEYVEEIQEDLVESVPEDLEEPVPEDIDISTTTRTVTTVLNIPFIEEQSQITVISLPYFTGETSILGNANSFERMESSDSSQEMIQARQSIEQYLPIFFATYAESNEVALSLLMEDVVLMGGDFLLEEVEISQARYRFVGENVLVQVEVIFRDLETQFTHRESFTLLLEEQANSWFVLEMHHLFVE